MGGCDLTGAGGGAVRTLAELQRWAAQAPKGTTIPVSSLARFLESLEPEEDRPGPRAFRAADDTAQSWRSRLWCVPAETRLSVDEVAEAVGRSKHWVYRATSVEKGRDRLPARKLDSRLEVTAGELRAWVRDHEEVLHTSPHLSVQVGGAR